MKRVEFGWKARYAIPEGEMTLTEIAVARRRIQGETWDEIGENLGISMHTAKGSLQALRKRWGLWDLSELFSDERFIRQVDEGS